MPAFSSDSFPATGDPQLVAEPADLDRWVTVATGGGFGGTKVGFSEEDVIGGYLIDPGDHVELVLPAGQELWVQAASDDLVSVLVSGSP